MKSNWETRPLGELVKFSSGGTPSKKNPEYWNGTIPWISAKTMKDERISTSDLMITEDGLASGSKLAPIGSLLLLTRGSGLFNGIPLCIVEQPVAFNQDVKCIESYTDVSNQFIFYWLKSQEQYLKAKLEVTGIGAGKFDTKFLQELNVPVPPKEERDKIVAIAESLSKRIIVNAKINDNLQRQAQAMFSAWLATHAPIADEVTLGSICHKVTDGSHFSPKDEPSAKIPMLSVKDMEEFDFSLTSCKHITVEDYQKMVANDCVPQVDDILVAKDGSYLKEIFICNEQRELAILSSIAIFRPDTSKIYPEILLAFLKSPRVLQEVRDNYVSGSALPRIVLKDFKKLQFLLPNLEVQREIAPLLASIRSQIAVNVAENQRLSQLRDALLPKLMSGEINVASIQT